MGYGINIGEKELLRVNSNMEIVDNVNSPRHYQGNGIEVIDIIESFDLNFNLGNTIKYVLRAGKKGNKKEDLEKAVWYLKRELNKFEG
jgi:hypothetical protein